MKAVNIYIETSIRGPRRCAGAYGYILETYTAAGAVTLTDFKLLPETTEAQSLALALAEALGRMRESCSLTIYTQSSYIESVLLHWLKDWKANGWMNKKDRPVADAEVWQKTAELLNAHIYDVVVGASHSYRDYLQRETAAVAAGRPFRPL